MPTPLEAIFVVTAPTPYVGWDVRTVRDVGAQPDTLAMFLIPDIPPEFQNLVAICPYSVAVAVVGLLPSLMTQTHRKCVDGHRIRPQSKVHRTGPGARVNRLYRGDRVLRNDRAVGHQCPIWWAWSAFNLYGRLYAVGAFRGAGRLGQPHSDARAGGDHDHGVHWHLKLDVRPDAVNASGLVPGGDAGNRRFRDSHAHSCQQRRRGRVAEGIALCRKDRPDFCIDATPVPGWTQAGLYCGGASVLRIRPAVPKGI